MRRLLFAALLACILGLSGCTIADMCYSLFGGMNSNDADLNNANSKNAVGTGYTYGQ